jgi:copper homeostasis protein
MDFKLEICVDNVESAINAEVAGANRVELCVNLLEGGTTPGYGTILSARNNLNIDINVLIRPRGGDFLYSNIEYDIMRRDVELCGEAGVDGIVIGILKSDGSIDMERTAKLIEHAHPMSVTFHRAFDMCSNPINGLEEIIAAGAARLLTSGQKNKAFDGSELIKKLVEKARDRIIIMPGSGINETNISDIAKQTGAKEFHLTGRKLIDSEMTFRKEGITMGGISGFPEFSRKVADPDMIRSIINHLKLI